MSFWSKVMINKYFLHQKSSLIYNDILLFTLLFYLNNLFFINFKLYFMWVFLFVFLILIFSKLKGKFILKKYYFLKEKRNEEIYFFF